VDISKVEEVLHLVNVLKVCQLKKRGPWNSEFRKSPASLLRVMRTCC
jgi:hypothetical protein